MDTKQVGAYAMEVATTRGFDDAVRRVTELLAERGFGVLTEIDVRETLKKKLGIETRPFRILGACNPTFAHRALEAEPHVAVLMPCNVVVWDEGARRVVAAMEPRLMADMVESKEVQQVSEEVSRLLREALEKIDAPA